MVHREIYRRVSHFVVHRILHTDDTPSRIARGVAIGIFVAWLPFIGLQMLIVLGLSLILRANKVVGLPLVWISNIFTLGPIYYPSYRLGSAMLGADAISTEAFTSGFTEICYSSLPWSTRLSELVSLLLGGILYPTLIGSLIIGSVLGLACYFVTVQAVKRYRALRIAHRAHQRLKKPDPIPFASPQDPAEQDRREAFEKPQAKVG